MQLFTPDTIETLPMRDADVSLLRRVPLPLPAEALLARLIVETPWRRENVTLWGKTYPQPRLLAWYGDPGSEYRYSGTTLEPAPWTPLLDAVKACVEDACDSTFNSVLLNCYRDERDSMGMHADDEPELGAQPTIASLSLGEERTLVFRHRHNTDQAPVRIPLPSGSLLIMRGTTQAHWKHGVNKLTRHCGPRINLTFRHIVTARG